jgi:CheY-like chemotaxis protein
MSSNAGKLIVWIEDDSPIIDPVVRPLERAGHHIVRLLTVRDVLDRLDVLRDCDLILLDIFVPPGEGTGTWGRYVGLDLLRELRSKYNINKPVVVLSVLTNEHVLEQLERQRVALVLRKPILPSKLLQAVNGVLQAEQARPTDDASAAK